MMCQIVFYLILCVLMQNATAQNYNETREKITKLKNEHAVVFAVSTSAYQIEGAWNESGKTESIWDRFVHTHPEKIMDESNGDISCDSYHNIDRDIKMLKYLGVKFYRFSISWPRISPTPMRDAAVNDEGLNYYHSLIDKLIENGITPVITLYHNDLPQNIQDFGGWTNELIIEYFENYAQLVFKNFASKVKNWITFDLPEQICHKHYGTDDWPPEISSSGIADYLCLRNLFLAHATVYRLYKSQFDTDNTGIMGINLLFNWYEPVTNSTEDIESVERFRKLFYGIQADPIHSEYGDFPELLKSQIANKSKEQGFRNSRLPSFTIAEIEFIRNTYDFMGITYFASYQLPQTWEQLYPVPSFEDDLGIREGVFDTNWTKTSISWLQNYPTGLKKVLLYIKNVYNNPKVMILGNGCGTVESTLENLECVSYFKDHLDAVYDAVVNDGCNVIGYSAWTLMDSFEWEKGYTERFGLFETDFDSKTRHTKPKATAHFFHAILSDEKNETTINPSTTVNPHQPPSNVDPQMNGSASLRYLSGSFNNFVILLIILGNLILTQNLMI